MWQSLQNWHSAGATTLTKLEEPKQPQQAEEECNDKHQQQTNSKNEEEGKEGDCVACNNDDSEVAREVSLETWHFQWCEEELTVMNGKRDKESDQCNVEFNSGISQEERKEEDDTECVDNGSDTAREVSKETHG